MNNSLPIFFFVFLAIGFSVYLYFVLLNYPLLDYAITDIEWTREWLNMAVLNYYGAAICLSAIAIATEGCVFGTLWALGFCMIGSSVCCFYLIYRLRANGIVLGGDIEVANEEDEEGLSMLGTPVK